MRIPSDGFLAKPTTLGTHQAILVLHAWWGLNETIKSICTNLKDEGYLVFAPDLYHGRMADTVKGAEALSETLFKNFNNARMDVSDAATFLMQHPDNLHSKVSVLGFSLGAFYALDVSITMPKHIQSVVTFYGTGPEDFSGSNAKYCCHFAETDDFEPFENVDALHYALEKAKRPAKFYKYLGTEHWFMEPDRPEYNAAAADLAWERTLNFLRE
ncbi:MAG: dienelactone hydrolase family protein [Anaerolineaceae bacterium]|nr:dienelactone hydrolase family protein [Anaerolineaceae bacterium]